MAEAAAPPSLDELIACPHCDALYRLAELDHGERAQCVRCHATLMSPRKHAGLTIIALALASAILIVAALFTPFLQISRLGFSNEASIIETALAFSDGPMIILSLAVVGLIVGLPLLRLLLTLYTLIPLVLDRKPWPRAGTLFRLSAQLKPWSMAEIFVIGCAVSLVKLNDLARVELGVAFWLFVAVVILLTIQDVLMDRFSVWQALSR